MKHCISLCIRKLVLYCCCAAGIAVAGCGSSTPDWKEKDAAEDKAIAAYFSTRKAELAERKNLIDSLLGTVKDEDETAGLRNVTDPGLIRQIKEQSGQEAKIKSTVSPLALTDFFLVYLEKDDEIGGYETDFREDFTRQYKPTTYRYNHVNIMLQSKDSVYEYPQASYENMFADFLKRKYLVVTDCICHIVPEISTDQTFRAGLIIKKIRIFDLQSRSLADEYYLVAESSESVYVRKASETAPPSPARLKTNLWRNYLNQFNYSLLLKEKFEGE